MERCKRAKNNQDFLAKGFKYMIDIIEKEKCSGCHACSSICPKNCISMNNDDEGFWYPQIDYEVCIHCNLCEKSCPILSKEIINKEPKAFACSNNDEIIRKNSSSGGLFTLFAECVLDNGGVVFGAAHTKDFYVEHIAITKKEELYKLRGSKYQQSKIGDAYKKVEEYLKDDILVYFSGTPCQIDGLKSYLKKEYDCLICQDIICHGVPSPKVFQSYLKELNEMYNEKPLNISYREKVFGWRKFAMKIDYPSKSYIKMHRDDLFMKVFLKDYVLRPSCYNCHSKSVSRNSDITLADFWGIEKICPDLNDDKGTSLVILHSEKGLKMFESISDYIFSKEVSVNEAIKYNQPMIKSVQKPVNRDLFMAEINYGKFNEIAIKFTKERASTRFKKKIKRVLKNILKHITRL